MEIEKLTVALGAYFLGAVYLAGLIAVGLVWGNHTAVYAGLASAGVGYLCQIAGLLAPMWLALILWGASLIAAFIGGFALIG